MNWARSSSNLYLFWLPCGVSMTTRQCFFFLSKGESVEMRAGVRGIPTKINNRRDERHRAKCHPERSEGSRFGKRYPIPRSFASLRMILVRRYADQNFIAAIFSAALALTFL